MMQTYGMLFSLARRGTPTKQYRVDVSWHVVSKAVMAAQGSILTNKYAVKHQVVVTTVGLMS